MRDQDTAVARTAAVQHGLITVGQLRAVGLTGAAIGRRTAAGRLHRIHRGVYAVGHPGLTTHAEHLAAVLACGEGAVLSHRAAAAVLGLLRGPAPPETTVRAEHHLRIPGVRVHRSRTLRDVDVSRFEGIPVTTVPRTLVDLAAELSLPDLARACHEAHVRHRTRLGLVVELDSYRFHASRHQWEEDVRRDRRSRAHGDVALRFTWGDVFERPQALLAELRPLLAPLGSVP